MSATSTEELPIPAGNRSPAPGLVVVSTPIGNLEDMTYRAVRVLASADELYCEDTRRTTILLQHFKIERKNGPKSFHDHSHRSVSPANESR